MSMLHKKGIRLKILILCLGCTLTGLFLQTLLFQNTSSQLIYNQAKNDSYRSMQNMQDDLQTFIKNIENGMIDIYNEKELLSDLKRKTDIDTMRTKYNRLIFNLATQNFDSSSWVVSMYLYDTDHQLISNYQRAKTPKHNYPKDIYDTSIENNAQKVRDYFESDDTGMLVTSYYNPYREKDIVRFVLKIYQYVTINAKCGYIVCDIDSKALKKIISKYNVDDEMFIWIQPQGDRPVISCGKLEDDCRASYKKLSDMIRKKEESAQDIRINDRELFSVYQEDYNLGAFSIMPKELLAKNEKVLNQNLLLITMIMLAVTSISFYFVSKSLSRPLEDMTKTVKRIQAGETHLRMENLKEDEAGELGKSFNNMLDQIEGLIAREYENKLLLNHAQYQALQAQINPHFLYNTLDTMGSIAEIDGCDQVSALCQSLAELFRYSLNMKKPFSTVSKEIVHLKNYIYIMNIRMQNQIRYTFDINDTILNDELPRISIQPLVENAINHGLKNYKGEKKIYICACPEEQNLVITVEDNGVGMSEERIRELFEESPDQGDKRDSIGILNIHKRMRLLFGEQYGVKIESTPGKGTRVILTVPRKKQGGKYFEEQKI